MNVVIHYPTGVEEKKELQKRVALVHNTAILKYIEKLPCPAEQKNEILSKLTQKI